jgi:hypothetical protein
VIAASESAVGGALRAAVAGAAAPACACTCDVEAKRATATVIISTADRWRNLEMRNTTSLPIGLREDE